MENEKKEWLDGIASEMSDLELDERKEAFYYFSERQSRVKNRGRLYWKPNGSRSLLRNVKKEYVNEIERIKKERNSSSQMILSKNVQISLYNGEINNNILVMAGSGRGKTYSLALPNAAQANASYVFSDPKGDVLRRIGTHLTEQLYKIKVINLIDMAQSNSYNPFHYLNKEHEEDVMTLIDSIMKNTDGDKKSNDPFWEKGEQLLLQCVFFYMLYELREDERSLPKALEILRLAEVREDNEGYISDFDAIMQQLGYEQFDLFDDTNEAWEELILDAENGDLEKQKLVNHYIEEKKRQEQYRNNHIAYIQYKHFKAGAGKTAKSIIISAVARLAPFNINSVRNMSLYDEMELDRIGEEKIALFIVMPPTNKTFEFISGMMLTQLFSELNKCANVKYAKQGARLPIPVRFILDEFKNTGKIPMFTEILAYARSLGISIMIILQSLEQLKSMYEKEWQVILDNCASVIHMGGIKNEDTINYLSKLLGKGTFDKKSYSESRGTNGSTTRQFDKVGIELMTPNAISQMALHKCILFVDGYKPVYDDTFDFADHRFFSRSEDGGNLPYEVNSDEIKNKQELFKLYLKKINLEDTEENERLDFLGNTLATIFTKMDQVRHNIERQKCELHIQNIEHVCNAVSQKAFDVMLNSGIETPTVEKTLYVESEAIKEVRNRKRGEETLIERISNNAFKAHSLNDEEIVNIVKNTISVQNVTFSSGATVNDIDAAINRVVNGMFSDESNTSSAESSDSSDMEEKQNEDVKHIDKTTSYENAGSSQGEEIDVENIAEIESTKHFLEHKEYEEQQYLNDINAMKNARVRNEKKNEEMTFLELSKLENDHFSKLNYEETDKGGIDEFDDNLNALMEEIDI